MTSTKLKCCVIDDEPLAADLIANYVRRTPSLDLVGVFNAAQDAFAAIASGDIALLFLDIQMPQLSGLEFARIIPPSTRVIFTTAYANYAIEGYKVNAIGYLLKPVSYAEFLEAVERAGNSIQGSATTQAAAAPDIPTAADSDYLMVKTEYRLRQIQKADILFVEGLKDYVKIFVAGEPRPIVSLLSLKSLERILPAASFMRVHRSFIVNLTKISTIERGNIMIGDHQIPVSDSFRPDVQAYVASLLPD